MTAATIAKWLLAGLSLAIGSTLLAGQLAFVSSDQEKPASAATAGPEAESSPAPVEASPKPQDYREGGGFPEGERSFDRDTEYYSVTVGGTHEIDMETPPKLECVGMPDFEDVSIRSDEVAGAAVLAQGTTGEAIEAFSDWRFEDSIALLAPGVRAGDPAAQFALGCVMEGLGRARFQGPKELEFAPDRQRDPVERAIRASRMVGGEVRTALYWLQAAAEADFKPARWEIARNWLPGHARNTPFAALHWVRRLSAEGDPRAQALLGYFYREGTMVPRDSDEASRLLGLSVGAGDRIGLRILADMHHEGDLGAKDEAASFALLERLADSGDAEGQYLGALALMNGQGVSRDPARAAAYLRKASEQGHAGAAYELFVLYREGKTVRADETLARSFLDEAVRRRDCLAMVEELAARRRSGPIDMEAEDVKERLQALGQCDPWPYSDDSDPLLASSPKLLSRHLFRERFAALEASLGRGSLDTTPIFGEVQSNDPTTARKGVASLKALAERIDPETGASDPPYSDQAAEAFAILAFPASWLPRTTIEQIDSEHWRQRFEHLPDRARSAVGEHILTSRLARQDMRALLALSRSADRAGDDLDTERGELKFLRRIGLQPAAFNLLLSRLDQGAKPESIGVELTILTYACSWTQAYSDWVSPMKKYVGDCGGLTALASLSIPQLQRLSDLGMGAADLYLAVALIEGRGIEPDTPRAIELIKRAGRGALVDALLGRIYEEGRGIAPDPARAAALYGSTIRFEGLWSMLSWERGRSTVLARYGRMLLEGEGVAADPERGVALLQAGVQFGVARAEVHLGDALALGLGVEQDRTEALRWYRQAAATDPLALVRLGFLAAMGEWNERGLGADRWYELAAQSEDPIVHLDLARAAAFQPKPRIDQIRRQLVHAAAMNNRWASTWLNACPGKSIECFKQQPGFARPFFTRIGTAWFPVAKRAAKPDRKASEATLSATVARLRGRITAAQSNDRPWPQVLPLLGELERAQTYHGDIDGAIATRMRILLTQDVMLGARYGSLRNYFAALDSSCHWGLASKTAYRLGRKEGALLFAKIAVNRLQDARAYIADLDSDVRECFIEMHKDRYRWLADLLIEGGRLAEAEAVLGMLKDFEYANYTGDRSLRGSSGNRLAFSDAEARVVAQLDDMTKSIPDDPGVGAQAGVAASDALHRNDDFDFQAELDQLIAAVTNLELNAPGERNTERIEWVKSINRAIVADLRSEFFPAGTATLHAVVLPERVHWLLSSRNGRKSITIDIGEREVDAAIAAMRADILTRSPGAAASAGKLYRMIFAPVDRELKRLGVTTAMLSLDSRLRYVPFAALNDGDGWLIERYRFSAFRRREDYLRKPQGPPWKVAAFASTAAGEDSLDPLPAAAREVRDIVRTGIDDVGIMDGEERVDGDFTKVSLSAALERDFRVVHIASHFVLDRLSAKGSYLLLGDGSRLPLLEFRADGRFTFVHADLVTLSACQTALGGKYGDGSEIDSIARMAQHAGAPAVIASLWSVADESTARLMKGFYERRVTARTSIAESMRLAQLGLLRASARSNGAARTSPDPDYSHPFYWAPFIVMGNWQ